VLRSNTCTRWCSSRLLSTGLMPLQVEMADRLIAHFLPGFVFSADCRPDSVYWVDAAQRRGASAADPKPREQRPGLRFFSAGPALTALEELIHVVERGEMPTTLNLGGEYSQKVLLPVLRHLRLYWALRPPQRRHQRHPLTTSIAVLQGFEHSYVVFSGAVPRLTREAGVQSAMLEDVSLGGFRACFDDAGGERIKLGALLCMQAEGGDNWLLGAARRINRLKVHAPSSASRCSPGKRRASNCGHAAAASRQRSPFRVSGCVTVANQTSCASCCRWGASMYGKRWISAMLTDCTC
jgi:hypothetical protein